MKRLEVNINTGETKEIQLTQSEIDAVNNAKIEQDAIASKNLQDKETKEANALTGNQKLLDLGLTQEEATALTGYTPPEENE